MKKVTSVGIILDGNRRWAVANGLKKTEGHEHGAKNVIKTIKWAQEEKIKELTLYVFSSENWNRSKLELTVLFALLEKSFDVDILKQERLSDVEFKFVGSIERFSKKFRNSILELEKESKKGKKTIKVYIALSYGGREEIVEGVKKLSSQWSAKKIEKLTEESFEKFLWTSEIHEPEIIIRTGGAKRLSNFLLWKAAYSELFFVDKMWPDFNKRDFKKILDSYRKVLVNKGK